MDAIASAKHFGLFGVFCGFIAGAAYGIGGFFVDLFTTGLNLGSALAMLALLGMPVIVGLASAILGALWAPIFRQIPKAWGGGE